MTKAEIREQIKRLRAGIGPDDKIARSRTVGEAVLTTDVYKSADSIMLYYSIGNEVDTTMIAEHSFADGKQVIYPVTDEESGRITPIEIVKGARFTRGGFGIPEPSGEVYTGRIDLVIVPGVAFDHGGGRLGFGKGCYDAFLSHTDAYKIGLCYDVQLLDTLPTEEHDVRMDAVVTESEIIYIKKKNA